MRARSTTTAHRPGRAVPSRRRGSPAPAVAVAIALAALLATPPTSAAAPSVRRWGPPFSSGREFADGGSFHGTSCAQTFLSAPAQFWLPSGRFYVNTSGQACQFSPSPSGATGGSFRWPSGAGIYNLTFHVPAVGLYNVSSRWSGGIWANLSIDRNRSAPGVPMYAGFNVTITTRVYCVQNATNVSSATRVLGSGNISNGSRSHFLRLGAVGPLRVDLRPGRTYRLSVGVTTSIFGSVGPRARYQATATATIDGREGLFLRRVLVS